MRSWKNMLYIIDVKTFNTLLEMHDRDRGEDGGISVADMLSILY